jgi:hypothetical protein
MTQSQIYGLVAGIGMIFLSFISSKLGVDSQNIIKLLPVLFYMSCIFLAIKKTRDIENDGIISIKTGVIKGVFAAFIASVLYGIYIFIAATHEDPLPQVLELKKSGWSNNEIAKQLSNVTNSILAQGAAIYAIFNFMIGFFTSVIAALMLRKSKGLLGQDNS